LSFSLDTITTKEGDGMKQHKMADLSVVALLTLAAIAGVLLKSQWKNWRKRKKIPQEKADNFESYLLLWYKK